MARCSDCGRVVAARRKRAERCAFGAKYTPKGDRITNAKHECNETCSWTWAEALKWNPPIRINIGTSMTLIQTRLVPVPPCANCERKRGEHWVLKANHDGHLIGYAPIPECEYVAA